MIMELLDILFPQKCVCCDDIISNGCLCEKCHSRIEQQKHCSVTENGVYYVYSYGDKSVKKIVMDMKQRKNKQVIDFVSGELSKLLSERIADVQSYTFTYVPRRLVNKMVNFVDQGREIAKGCASKLGANYISVVSRRPFTKEQKKLTAQERRKNLDGKFYVKKGVALPERIIIVDDVTTTGTTLSNVADMLKDNGVQKVLLVAFSSRGLNNNEKE